MTSSVGYENSMDDQHPARVVVDPEVMCGTPCLAGSRLPVQTLLDMVNGGESWERIVHSWPWLTPAHVEAAREWHGRIRYGVLAGKLVVPADFDSPIDDDAGFPS
jgi:uncharacterized protein (DUF433 family)